MRLGFAKVFLMTCAKRTRNKNYIDEQLRGRRKEDVHDEGKNRWKFVMRDIHDADVD